MRLDLLPTLQIHTPNLLVIFQFQILSTGANMVERVSGVAVTKPYIGVGWILIGWEHQPINELQKGSVWKEVWV